MKGIIPNKASHKIIEAKLRLLSTGGEVENEQQVHQSGIDEELFIRQAFKVSPEHGCELLFRRYHQALCSHAIRFVYSKEIAEDIVSEVFCKFWRTKAYTGVTSSYRFYLFKSVRNAAYTYLRLEFQSSTSLDLAFGLESPNDLRPDYITQFEEISYCLKMLVEALPPQCRKVFLKSRFEGKRYQEIADEMGLSIKTVEVHLVKALSLIRKGLKDFLILFIGLSILCLKNGISQ
jgi:RNA polymerase sigma-70 factor (ECF subfamily)